jgi:hypothetical protein
MILVIPAVLPAQEETESQEESVEKLEPGPLWEMLFKKMETSWDAAWKALVELSAIFLKLLPVILLAALIKIHIIKRKLAIPWKLRPVEKLSVATVAETVAEMYFLLLFMVFFIPAVSSVLKDTALAAPATEAASFLKFLIHTLVALPYYCVLGGILSLLLFRLVSPKKLEKLGRYFKYGAFLATIPAGLFIVFVFLSRIVLKWNYV